MKVNHLENSLYSTISYCRGPSLHHLFSITILLISIFINATAQDNALVFSDLSDLERREEFIKRTEQRVKDLETNIKTIGDKKVSTALRLGAVNATVKYFIDEDKIFQVSSLRDKNPRSYKIRKYLNRLIVLDYYRVEIEWFDSQWVTKFRAAPNGKYYGVIRIFQVFKGYGTDKTLRYIDRTVKDIEVEINVVQMDIGDMKKEVLDVRLGDVKVQETY